ncbi:dephospho-CoA kinase [Halochromatium sp.]
MTYRVGLTGGIGSGKSTVAAEFAHLGVTVSDADAISHRLTGPDGDALPAIASAFGAEMIDTTGALDRAQMRQRVFSDDTARRRLEGILHPLIRARMFAEAAAIGSPYALLMIPLLLETGQQSLVDRVLVVDLPEAMQISRVQARSGLEPNETQRIMASQVSRAARLDAADDIIDNSGEPHDLKAQVEQLHQTYLKLAHQHAG